MRVWADLQPPNVGWSSSFSAADWIGEGLHPFARDIGSVIPDCFHGYVAIEHGRGSHELPADRLALLCGVVAEHTSTPTEIWYCIWDGYAWLHGGGAVSGSPPGAAPVEVQAGGRVRLPKRDYYLFRGDLSAASVLVPDPWRLRPNLWWPEDRAWCVASEIDLVVTYVGGTEELAEAIAGDPRLVAAAISPDEAFLEGRDY